MEQQPSIWKSIQLCLVRFCHIADEAGCRKRVFYFSFQLRKSRHEILTACSAPIRKSYIASVYISSSIISDNTKLTRPSLQETSANNNSHQTIHLQRIEFPRYPPPAYTLFTIQGPQRWENLFPLLGCVLAMQFQGQDEPPQKNSLEKTAPSLEEEKNELHSKWAWV